MKHIILIITLCLSISVIGIDAEASKLDSSRCPKNMIEFDDGDSFSCMGEPIRVLGIDTPETKHPKHGIMKDQPFGKRAAAFTKGVLEDSNRIVIVRGGRDPYGRTLAHVIVDGELLGVKLIKAGLAYQNVTRYGDNGLPEFALQITEAWNSVPKPPFEDPHVWRKKNRK